MRLSAIYVTGDGEFSRHLTPTAPNKVRPRHALIFHQAKLLDVDQLERDALFDSQLIASTARSKTAHKA